MNLSQQISAVLFYTAEPTSVARLAKLLSCTENDIRSAFTDIESSLAPVGLCLMRNGDNIALGTSPEAGALIEKITTEELSRELSRAALETLAIVLYKGPVSRGEIDYIRGVNSTFILRNLQVRGLVERIENPEDQRSFLYRPTLQLLEYMGVSKVEDLPRYHETLSELSSFVAAHDEEAGVHEEVSRPPENSLRAEEHTQTTQTEESDEHTTQEADVSEEDLAQANFDDNALRAHHDHKQP